MFKEYAVADLLTIWPVVHIFMGEENWYFIIVKTGEQGFVKLP